MAGNMLTTVQRIETLAHQLRELREALNSLQFCEDVLYKFDCEAFPLEVSISLEDAERQHREAARAVLLAAFKIA
jgi:transcriptional regulator of met regulon